MREQFDEKKSLERNALSSREGFYLADNESSELHYQQLHEIVLRKQKLIIYLSILYTAVVLGILFYLVFLK